jgi:hypothetical protein
VKTGHELNPRDKSASLWVLVCWVGFLAACVLEGLVFSVVDPGDVHWAGQMPQPTRQGIYTVAFFCFWLISSLSARVVLWLAEPGSDVNDTAVD